MSLITLIIPINSLNNLNSPIDRYVHNMMYVGQADMTSQVLISHTPNNPSDPNNPDNTEVLPWYTNLGDIGFYLINGINPNNPSRNNPNNPEGLSQDIYWMSRDTCMLIRGI